MTTSFQSDWSCPPGATIKDAIRQRGLSLNDFARGIGRSLSFAEQLTAGEQAINHDLAISLADTIGASPRFWMQRELDYRTDLARLSQPSLDQMREWLSGFPLADMASLGWIPQSRIVADRFKACLDFFGVGSIGEWQTRYAHGVQAAAFRTSYAFEHDDGATAAWLRFGEIAAQGIQCQPWNKAGLRAAIPVLKRLTRISSPKTFIPELRRILAANGVALVIARTPKGCRASGATRFLSTEKAMMILSFRYKSDDHFWFTVFHEIGHLVLHDQTHIFLEGSETPGSKEESEANQFSQDTLVSADKRNLLYEWSRNYKEIIRLAAQLGISPGILVGQMQFLKIVDKRRLNFLKRHYDWDDIAAATL